MRSPRSLVALVALAAAAIAGLAAQRGCLRPSTPATTVASPPQPPPKEPNAPVALAPIGVTSVEGIVERQAPGASSWSALHIGDALAVEDAVRTAEGGRATLEVANGPRVALASSTQLSVRDNGLGTTRLRLESGRLDASIAETSDTDLQVESRGSAAVAQTRDGDFSLLASGEGQVTIAARRGRVRFSTGNEVVELHEGQQSSALGNGAPSPPAAIPSTLFLKVAGASQRVQRERTSTIQGEASPGAVVRVNGVVATTQADGRFSVLLPLAEGANAIVVVAEDIMGRRERADGGTLVVNPGHAHDSKARWGDQAKTKGRVVW